MIQEATSKVVALLSRSANDPEGSKAKSNHMNRKVWLISSVASLVMVTLLTGGLIFLRLETILYVLMPGMMISVRL